MGVGMYINLRYMAGVELELKDLKVVFDPLRIRRDADLYLISHAHSDHYPNPKQIYLSYNIYSSPETRDIICARHGAAGWIKEIRLDRPVVFKDRYIVAAYPSGHMLGSRGFIIDDGNVRIAYTGDLNNRVCLSTVYEAAVPDNIDILIIEATYGHPTFRFGDHQQLWLEMVRWATSTVENGFLPCFKGYTAGKSQEIEAIFSLLTNIPIYPHPMIHRVNKVYSKYGIDFVTKNIVHNIEEAKLMVSPKYLENWAGKKVLTASATGKILLKGDFGFPLSSHADYPSLLRYIRDCNPKFVFTVYGYSESLAYSVGKKLNIPARALTDKFQKVKL